MKVPEPRKLPSGTWFINLRLGGVNVPVSASTKKECTDAAALIKAEYKAGKRLIKPKSELTLKQACERYIARKEKQNRSPETVRGYDVILRNRFQGAMDTKVTDITNWQELYDQDAKHLSQKTMENTWSFIRSACKTECGIDLPVIEKLSEDKKEHLFLDQDQVKTFIKATVGNKHQIAMLLHLSSLRASEVRGLTWENINLDKKLIHVSGAMVRDKKNQLVLKNKNKTDDSDRYVPLFIPELEAALAAVPENDRKGYVVKERANSVYVAINKLCKANGLPEVGTHGLRHSFASVCYSIVPQVPPKIVMQIGGWSDYNTVMRIYTHLAKKDITKYTDELSGFFQ